jgi:signal peptidase II
VKNKYLFLGVVGGGLVAIDQYTKHLAVEKLKGGAVVEVVRGFFDFRYVENPGAAWGFLSWAKADLRVPFFIGVSMLAVAFILYFFHRLPPAARTMTASLTFIMGGAIGNFIDRLRYGYVVDFIHWFYRDYHWPTFNVADAAISVGVSLMVLLMLFGGDMGDGKAGDRKGSGDA